MDTRRKILAPDNALKTARALRAGGTSISLISGYFDVLQPALIRQLQAEGRSERPRCLFALVLDPPNPLLSLQARIELAAALQVIDYVIDSTSQAAEFIASLAPDRFIRAQEDDLAAREQLIHHVLERHGHKNSGTRSESH